MPVSPYFVLLTIGLAMGCAFLIWRGGRQGIQRIVLVDVCLAAVFGGIAGGRLLHVAVEPLPADPVVLNAKEREHLSAIRAEATGHELAVVEAALAAQSVPEVWRFVAHMPAGSWRAAAIEAVDRQPDAVPVRWWYAARPLQLPQFWKGGLAWMGGLLSAAVLCALVIRRHGASVGELADLAGPAVALGLIFGRLGCFLNGCCFGEVCEPAWYAHTPSWYPTVLHGSRYPTALMASGLGLLVTVAGLAYAPFKRRAGEVGLFCVVLYAPGRFVIEGLRADPRGGAGGLSTSQWLALAFGVPALLAWAWARFGAAPGPAAPAPDPQPAAEAGAASTPEVDTPEA